MKRSMAVILVIFGQLFSGHSQAFEGQQHMLATLLASMDSEKIRLASKSIVSLNIQNEKLFDITAELLWLGASEKIYVSSDSMSWLAKSLAASQSERYKDILLSSRKHIQTAIEKVKKEQSDDFNDFDSDWDSQPKENNRSKRPRGSANLMSISMFMNNDHIFYERNPQKVDSHIIEAIKSLTIKAGANYIAGTVSIISLQKQLTEGLVELVGNRSANLGNVAEGDELSLVYTKVGYPDYPSVSFDRKRVPFAGSVLVTNLQFNYNDLGYIKLEIATQGYQISEDDFSDDNDNEYEVSTAREKAWRVLKIVKYKGGLKNAVKSFKGKELVYLAKKIHAGRTENIESLDAVADRIWQSKDTQDGYTAKGVALLCKVLGQSGYPRYRTLLQNVIDTATNRKIKKYAIRSLRLLPPDEFTQYVMYKPEAKTN